MFKILHIETSSLYQKLISDICLELDIDYVSCSSSKDALEILATDNISLIVTAMEIREGSIERFIELINRSYSKVPIVVITGNDTFDDRKKMYDLGIVDYIVKKSSRDEIRDYLKAFAVKSKTQYLTDMYIAVCDDSKVDRKITERIFRINSINRVDFYEDPEEMFEAGRNYDIYLIDLILKDSSGHQVIKKLRSEGCKSVIIAISGIDNVKTISHVLSLGADDYITKPYNNDIFMARIRTCARSYSLYKEVKEKTLELEKMAKSDGLTGLLNHMEIFRQLDLEIEKKSRYGDNLSLIMFDLDFFKNINDTYGHLFGDRVLESVSSIIQNNIRNVDLAGRYGGEEFMIILPKASLKQAVETAERIRDAIENCLFENVDLKVTISGGVAECIKENSKELVSRADNLLYKAKEGGRNNIQF
ncbi:MAG: diguanylate cyclase [Spirochaetes bacterium]|nr:diguanylate cyclase [Spirochaetota bacterium]MBN2769766.1 diguanylate cyclase [Spirochaetota bacterium]